MLDSLVYIFESGDIWAIILKVVLTALFTALLGLVGTLLGKIISKCKKSKIYSEASIAVQAAEQKFPNEGTKMGPEKMAYVMDYLAIRFPKIKSNQYLYNIAEAAVYELNKQKQQEAAKKEFEEKYGDDIESITNIDSIKVEEPTVNNAVTKVVNDNQSQTTSSSSFDLKSF